MNVANQNKRRNKLRILVNEIMSGIEDEFYWYSDNEDFLNPERINKEKLIEYLAFNSKSMRIEND